MAKPKLYASIEWKKYTKDDERHTSDVVWDNETFKKNAKHECCSFVYICETVVTVLWLWQWCAVYFELYIFPRFFSLRFSFAPYLFKRIFIFIVQFSFLWALYFCFYLWALADGIYLYICISVCVNFLRLPIVVARLHFPIWNS